MRLSGLIIALLLSSLSSSSQRINMYCGLSNTQLGLGIEDNYKKHKFEGVGFFTALPTLNIPKDLINGIGVGGFNSAKNQIWDRYYTISTLYSFAPIQRQINMTISIGPNINISEIAYFYPHQGFNSFSFLGPATGHYKYYRETFYKPGITAMIKVRYYIAGLYAMANIANGNSFANAGIAISINPSKKSQK